MVTIQDWIDRDYGIKGHWSTTRVFFPRKPRKCRNCHFTTYGFNYNLSGCEHFETKEDGGVQKPINKCYPVMDDGHISELHAYAVRLKIYLIDKYNNTDDKYVKTTKAPIK